jgi:hypothetical protein
MQTLAEMTNEHPIASLWVALTIFSWIAVQTMPGARRRRDPRARPNRNR